MLPGRRRRLHRRVDRAVDHEAMPLVVVRASPVLRQVERVDGRAEEELAEVVHRLRQRVRDAVVAPSRRPLHERDVQAVVVGLADRRVLAVVRVVRVRPAAVVGARGDAARHVLIHRHQQVQPAQVLIADADGGALARSAARPRRSPAASTRSADSRSIVVRFTSVTDGTTPLRMFGNAGAPACVGDRLTPIWRRLARSVVLPADSSALASARSGTRS